MDDNLLQVRLHKIVKCTLRAAGSSTEGEIEHVRLVGPRAPTTKRGFGGVLGRDLVASFTGKSGTGVVQLVSGFML
jgi:hypothetical protein